MASTSVGSDESLRVCYLSQSGLSSVVRSPRIDIYAVNKQPQNAQARLVSSIVGIWGAAPDMNKGVTKAGVNAGKKDSCCCDVNMESDC
jgi:hypothetical protein